MIKGRFVFVACLFSLGALGWAFYGGIWYGGGDA